MEGCHGKHAFLVDATREHVEAMARNKPGQRSRAFKREFPHLVEVAVPPCGLGKQLDAMHAFHTERDIKACLGRGRREDNQDYLRWYFADAITAASFAIEFMGTHRTQSKALAATARAVRASLPTKH
jgi:hypothetical protein